MWHDKRKQKNPAVQSVGLGGEKSFNWLLAFLDFSPRSLSLSQSDFPSLFFTMKPASCWLLFFLNFGI